MNVDDACFTVSFNKAIYEPDFTADDIVLTGEGNVYDFEKTGENEWTVRINGMEAGSTITLSLAELGIKDLSAVFNETQVLGINTVRYEVADDQSSGESTQGDSTVAGTLPETGANTVLWHIAAMLTLFGSALTFGSRRSGQS